MGAKCVRKAAADGVGGEEELVFDEEKVGGQLGLFVHVIASLMQAEISGNSVHGESPNDF